MAERTATKKQITTELSAQQVTLSAQQLTAVFEATVYNDSDRFASFQLKLLAAGSLPGVSKSWYRLTPSVSSKIPAGDCTRFQIEIFDLPPIAQQFRGLIDLTVEVTSRELENQYDRQTLRLQVEGLQGQPPGLSLVASSLEALPLQRVAILAQVQNPTGALLEVTLRLLGLPETWFADGIQQTLSIPPGKPVQVRFEAAIPAPILAPSQIYPLQVEATGRFPTVIAPGQLHVLPAGSIQFTCAPPEATIPEALGRWQNPTVGTALFTLHWNNQSNLEPILAIGVREIKRQRRWFWQTARAAAPAAVPTSELPAGVLLGETTPTLAIGASQRLLLIRQSLPWLGWTRLRQFEVVAQVPETTVPLEPEHQTVQIHLFPVIPLWLQVLGLLLAAGLGALAWFWLMDTGHRGPVRAVQFNGQGTEVVSGSDDQTILRWQLHNGHLKPQHRIGNLNKAVRVVRYRPVNNDQVAIGFENGEIQVANLLTGQRVQLTPDKDDRVFALVFSRDARTLYSAHGSGLVLPWDISQLHREQITPETAYDTQFAIQTMTLVGSEDRYLAIGGRFNRFVLLDLDTPAAKGKQAFLNMPYPSGSSTDYITSLGVAEQQPNLLAVADTQGRLGLWNLEDCLKQKGQCGSIEQPWLGHGGSPIRAVALSASGCFLASAADDGEVKLWPLDGQGLRRSSASEGRVLSRGSQPLNAVDILETRQAVWVTSGGEDGQVRLDQVPLEEVGRQADRCPVVAGSAGGGGG